jgi:CheY-like chemotaxis protein
MRIVVAEDEVLLREGLARLLTEAGFEVVGKAGDAAGLLRLVDARRPELVLTDIKMPPTHSDEGLDAAHEIRRMHPRTGVLVLSHRATGRSVWIETRACPHEERRELVRGHASRSWIGRARCAGRARLRARVLAFGRDGVGESRQPFADVVAKLGLCERGPADGVPLSPLWRRDFRRG